MHLPGESGSPPGPGGLGWHNHEINPSAPPPRGFFHRLIYNCCSTISSCLYFVCCCGLIQDCFRGARHGLGPPPPPAPPRPHGPPGIPRPSGPSHVPFDLPGQPAPPGPPSSSILERPLL